MLATSTAMARGTCHEVALDHDSDRHRGHHARGLSGQPADSKPALCAGAQRGVGRPAGGSAADCYNRARLGL
jgi:hypothetical protein